MSQSQLNKEPELANAVDLLITRYGLDGAENRLVAALSEVRQRKQTREDET